MMLIEMDDANLKSSLYVKVSQEHEFKNRNKQTDGK